MRVCFVDYVLEPDKPGRTGLSDIVWDMASELVDIGHQVHIIASYLTWTYPDPRVIVHNFPAPPIGYRNVVGQILLLHRAAGIAKRLQPDVIHAPEYVSTAVFATSGVKSPLVVTVPGNVFHRIKFGHSYEWHFLQVLKWAARVSARRCAYVIAISQEMKRWWEWTGSAPDRTPWIPLGVNERRFHVVPDARVHLGVPDDTVLLLYVGRFAREKGLLDLLEALSRVKGLIGPRRVKVLLIGKGPQADELLMRVRQDGLQGVVEILPWVPQGELSSWYSAADALLLPSHTEAFSRTIPEAMICGTPVIGTRITGTEDHVRDGVTGFTFAPGNREELAAILSRVIDRPETIRDMRRTTLSYAEQSLTWPCIVRRVIREVYEPIAQARADLTYLA